MVKNRNDSNFHEWMNLPEILNGNTYLKKLKVTLIVISGHGQICLRFHKNQLYRMV